jgi:type 1 glutamine amidotransferase
MKALIIQGGWNGHEPETVANFFADVTKMTINGLKWATRNSTT